MADWSNLPEDLLNYIAVRLFSAVELKRFRSICTSWRSSVSVTGNNNLIPRRPLIHFTPILSSFNQENNNFYRFKPAAFLSRAAFFRVTLSSSTSKGWLIKFDVDVNSGRFRLLQAVSHQPLRRPLESLDLLEFTVSEIQETYAVLVKHNGRITSPRFNRSVLVKVKEGDEDHHYGVLGIGHDGNITYWKGQDLEILEQVAKFSDIIVHKGLTYALDSQGTVWLISSDLEISRYGPSLDENITNGCYGDMRFVECSGELYIVERLPKGNLRKRKVGDPFHCAGFKVYKMDDEELGRLIEVKSLGDNAFIMASDICFSVLAHEFYGCIQNSIYFTEDKEIKVFKLDNSNGSIATRSEFPSSFQMFVPSFLRIFV